MSQRNCKILTLIHPPWWTRKGPIGAINMGIVKSPKVSYKGRTEAKIDTPIKPLVSSNHWMPKSHLCEVHAFTSFKYCFAHRFARSSRGWSFCSSAESSISGSQTSKMDLPKCWGFLTSSRIISRNAVAKDRHQSLLLLFLGWYLRANVLGKSSVFESSPPFSSWVVFLFLLSLFWVFFSPSPLAFFSFTCFLCLSASLRLSLRSSCFLGASLYFRFRGSFSLGRTTFFLWGTLLSLFRFPGLGCRSLHPRIQGFLHLLLLASVHLDLQGFLFSKAIRVMLR